MNSNDKYNMLVKEISSSKDKNIYPKTFGMNYQEFKSIIDEIEKDGLFEKGWWALAGFYIFNSLTFNGRSFIENNDKKEYLKIEKTEINHHHNISIGGDNNGNIITGNNNIINSEFDRKFYELINAINNSNIQDKQLLIEELKVNKNDEISLKKTLGMIITKGSEITSIVSAVVTLLSLF
ncbi:MAG: hypothetical protein WCR78_02700 [Arcobacteraceae bacterium]